MLLFHSNFTARGRTYATNGDPNPQDKQMLKRDDSAKLAIL
jgi:hypothetical protein